MANDMKTLKVIAANGTISFPVVDQTARDAASAAQSAVAKISIPTSLPNPKKLRFTGGATGEYDGSADVTITIPTGGSGGGTVTDEQIGSAVEDYMDDHFGGNTIYYLNGNLEYKPGGVYFNDIASSSLSDEGRGIKAGDFIISSNNVLCKVTSVENSRVYYSQFAQLGASGGDEPDLVIGLNVANTKAWEDGSTTKGRWLTRMKAEDVSVISGDIAATAEKVTQGIPVRVALKEIHIYDGYLWHRGIAEATHVLVGYNGTYPADTPNTLNLRFFLSDASPIILGVEFYIATGNVHNFFAQPICVDSDG